MRAFAFLTLAGGILTAAPVPASAALIVRNFTISISGSAAQDFNSTPFAKFDPSFGTLTHVDESLTGSATWSLADPGETLLFVLGLTSATQLFTSTGDQTPIVVNMSGVSPASPTFIGPGSITETLFSRGQGTLSSAALTGTMTYTYTPSVGSPVPEPSTWAMMLIGFAGLGYAAVRRKGAVRKVSA